MHLHNNRHILQQTNPIMISQILSKIWQNVEHGQKCQKKFMRIVPSYCSHRHFKHIYKHGNVSLEMYRIWMIMYSSEIRGLCLMKWPCEILQNLPYFWNTKTHVFFSFSKNMANFEAFLWSKNLFFLKSVSYMYTVCLLNISIFFWL